MSSALHLCAEDDQGAAVLREDGPAEEPAALRGSSRSAGEPPASCISFLHQLPAPRWTDADTEPPPPTLSVLPPPLPTLCPQVTREERMVVKPLYDRYRLVKQMLTRVSITPVTVRARGKTKSPPPGCFRRSRYSV